jgi:UDP-N-acetylglucosamine:LPS N-acetylglucosamine transferase
MKKVALVYFNAGGGHRAAAQALQAVIAEQRRPWEVHLVNLFEVLDPQGLFRKVTGLAPEDYYNKRLARGWTLGLAQELVLLQGLIRLGHAVMLRRLEPFWDRLAPDLVVSLVPNFNRVLYQSLQGIPLVTVMTDIADLPPNFWIEPGQDQHLVCGSARAVEQARAAGYAEDRIHRSSGMILRPDFYRPSALDRAALGLDPARATGVVLFGGHGSQVMQTIARELHDTPLILLCGHNQRLQARLRAMPASAPRVVVGHTSEVAGYMRLADFFIGKPGPGSLSEALHCGLPVIVTRNAWTMPQERYNTDWVRENDVGVVLPSFRGIQAAVAGLLPRLDALRAQVGRLHNRAVFEVPDLLARLLAAGEASRDCRSDVMLAS